MILEIIAIDDDDIVLFLHELYLKENFTSNDIKTFNSAENAIEYFLKKIHHETEYLVVIDINMPRMNGWDFIETIKQLPFYSKMHIVIASASIDVRDKEKANSYSRVIDFCEKPINDELCLKFRGLPGISKFFSI